LDIIQEEMKYFQANTTVLLFEWLTINRGSFRHSSFWAWHSNAGQDTHCTPE